MSAPRIALSLALVALAAPSIAAPSIASAQSFDPPGTLTPSTAGDGRADSRIYAPNMRFPIRDAPAYANSQVYGHGGGMGPGGGQCDAANFSYPWHDNYCERRQWNMPLCPSGHGHQGQDIRASDCRAGVHPVVAVVDGRVSHIGSYTVYITGADGTRYDYLHMSGVRVTMGQRVHCGDVIGNVDHVFDGNATTNHLHFNIKQAVAGVGSVFVPPYSSLVDAYQRLLAGDACSPSMDAGVSDAGRDASMPRDAAMARDAYTPPRDAYTPGRDAYVPPRDAYVPPRDAYTPPRDAYVPPRDAYTPRDTGGSCRSTILGRTVSDGECVQLPPSRTECSGSGCGWYQCRAGAWACAAEADCGTTHPNAACSAAGDSCYSTVVAQQVQHGDCVQVNQPACGAAICGWYRCVNGDWACSDAASCSGERYSSADCTDCTNLGDSCHASNACCGNASCEPIAWGSSSNTCCFSGNLPCASADDCCGTMECMNGVCQCHNTGGACAGDVDCCSGLWCTNGRCGIE